MSDRDTRDGNPANGQASELTLAELLAASPRAQPPKMRPFIQSAEWTPAAPDAAPQGRPEPPKLRAYAGPALPAPPSRAVVVHKEKPPLKILPKLTTLDKVLLGTVAFSEAEIEALVGEYRRGVYAPYQGSPATRYPGFTRSMGRAGAERTIEFLKYADDGGPSSLVPYTGKGLTIEEMLWEKGILRLPTYLECIRDFRKLKKQYWDGKFIDHPEAMRLIKLDFDPRKLTADFNGWMYYLKKVEPGLVAKIEARRKRGEFPAKPRTFHTHIVARNGWGKSELLKALAFHDIQHETGSLVVVDPLGDLVKQIARFPELAVGDRLVLIQPELTPGQYPCMNPLEKPDYNETERASYAETLAASLSLISENKLSPPMQNLATACLRVLLDRPGSTLADLVAMLDEPEKGAKGAPAYAHELRDSLLKLGENHPSRQVAEFFRYRFNNSIFKSSKAGLMSRISGLLMLPAFEAMTCGPSTFNLEKLVDSRKVVLFNLSQMGDGARFAYGRLLLALLEDIGKRRVRADRLDRVPVQVLVDEATMVVSPTMLTMINGLRKFGVHLTLAQQVNGQSFERDGRDILDSVGVKIAGSNSRRELVDAFEDEGKDLGKIERQQFWVRWGEEAPVELHVRSDLADGAHATPDEVWRDTVAAQARFYRKHLPAGPLAPLQAIAGEPVSIPRPGAPPALEPGIQAPRKPPGGRNQARRLPRGGPGEKLRVD